MKKIDLFQVDAFTKKPFKGNPAAVCLLTEDTDVSIMQSIAAENNLAETAFIQRRGNGFDLRWFTPTVEVDLCGHATLATAHILWQEKVLPESAVAEFHTRSGLLKATKKGDWIELDFPISEITQVELPAGILRALHARPVNTAFAKDRYIIELESAEEVRALRPDFISLKDFEMVVVTARGAADSSYDFVSRTFAAAYGIDEDPVTGSSHCGLAPYWAKELGKNHMFAEQSSKRGGELTLKIANDRVLISGQAVTVLKGVFYV